MKRFLIIALALVFMPCLMGQTKTAAETLSLDHYLQMIAEQLPDFEIYRDNLKKSALNISKAKSRFDVQLNGGVSGIGQQNYTDSDSTSSYYTPGFSANSSLSSLLPLGTKISIGAEYTQLHGSGDTTVTTFNGFTSRSKLVNYSQDTYDTVIKLTINQPLIYNWFGFLDRYAVKDAQSQYQIDKLQYEENKKSVFTYYQKLYFSWIKNSLLLEELEKSIANLRLLAEQTREKFQTGFSDNADYQRALYSVLKLEEQKEVYQLELQTILNELAYFFDPLAYQPDYQLLADYLEIVNKTEFKAVPFEQTNSAAILSLSRDKLELTKKAKINQALPNLELFGDLNIKYHINDKVTDGEYTQYANLGDIDFKTGIQFSYALGSIQARAEIRETKLSINLILNEYDQTLRNYQLSLNNILSQLQSEQTKLALNASLQQTLKKQYQTEKEKYLQGRLDLKNLIDTENSSKDEIMGELKSNIRLIQLYFDYQSIIH